MSACFYGRELAILLCNRVPDACIYTVPLKLGYCLAGSSSMVRISRLTAEVLNRLIPRDATLWLRQHRHNACVIAPSLPWPYRSTISLLTC